MTTQDLTDNQRHYAQQRWHHALWYAFGRNDGAGEEYVDPLKFAEFAEQEAIRYITELECVLDSIETQYNRYWMEQAQ